MLQAAQHRCYHSLSFGVIRSALVPLHAWGWKMVTERLVEVLRGSNLLEHTTWLGACGCSRDYADEKNCTQDPSRSRWKIFERRAALLEQGGTRHTRLWCGSSEDTIERLFYSHERTLTANSTPQR